MSAAPTSDRMLRFTPIGVAGIEDAAYDVEEAIRKIVAIRDECTEGASTWNHLSEVLHYLGGAQERLGDLP